MQSRNHTVQEIEVNVYTKTEHSTSFYSWQDSNSSLPVTKTFLGSLQPLNWTRMALILCDPRNVYYLVYMTKLSDPVVKEIKFTLTSSAS
jgi:hypothetical protein